MVHGNPRKHTLPSPAPEFFRPSDVPSRYGLSLPYIRKLIQRRQVPVYRIGRAVLIKRDDFEVFLAARRVEVR